MHRLCAQPAGQSVVRTDQQTAEALTPCSSCHQTAGGGSVLPSLELDLTRALAPQVINDAFMLKQTLPSAPDPDDGHHEQHPMSWSKSANVNGELEEVGLCQYRTTEEAKACRKRGPSMAYCNRMPSCKRKGSVQHARAASGKPPKGKEQEAGGQEPGLAHSFMCSCCRCVDAAALPNIRSICCTDSAAVCSSHAMLSMLCFIKNGAGHHLLCCCASTSEQPPCSCRAGC